MLMRRSRRKSLAEAGLEQVAKTSGKTKVSGDGGAESGAVVARNGAIDADLVALLNAVERLDDAGRLAILDMLKAAEGGR